jgi:hypothetical protein
MDSGAAVQLRKDAADNLDHVIGVSPHSDNNEAVLH